MQSNQKKRRYAQSQEINQVKFTDAKRGPRSRPVHAAAFAGDVLNGEPGVHYVKANGGEEEDFNVEYYESIGYEVVKASKGGVRVKQGGKVTIGQPITWRGMVLMSCTKDRHDEIFNNGADGNTGQAYFDNIMLRANKGMLEKRINVPGMYQQEEFSLLEGDDPEIFR
jgi:hypothetical protein